MVSLFKHTSTFLESRLKPASEEQEMKRSAQFVQQSPESESESQKEFLAFKASKLTFAADESYKPVHSPSSSDMHPADLDPSPIQPSSVAEIQRKMDNYKQAKQEIQERMQVTTIPFNETESPYLSRSAQLSLLQGPSASKTGHTPEISPQQQYTSLESSGMVDSLQGSNYLDTQHQKLFGEKSVALPRRFSPHSMREEELHYSEQPSPYEQSKRASPVYSEPTYTDAGSEYSPQVGSALLTYEDILTSEDTVAFWRKYFHSIERGRKLRLEIFLKALADQFEELMQPSRVCGTMEKQRLIKKILEEIGLQVSIDGNKVSLNSLEIWTREAGGLCAAVRRVSQNVAQDRAQLNEAIVREVEELNFILVKKNEQLAQKELELTKRETYALSGQQEAQRIVEETGAAWLEKSERYLMKKVNQEVRRLQEMERLTRNRLQILKAKEKENKMQNQKKPGQSTIKQSQQARLVTLEKAVETLRNKTKVMEEKLNKEQKEKEGLLEKLEKLRSKNSALSEQLKTANKKKPEEEQCTETDSVPEQSQGYEVPLELKNLEESKQREKKTKQNRKKSLGSTRGAGESEISLKNTGISTLPRFTYEESELTGILCQIIQLVGHTVGRTVSVLFTSVSSGTGLSPNITNISGGSVPHSPALGKVLNVWESSQRKGPAILVKPDSYYSSEQPLRVSLTSSQPPPQAGRKMNPEIAVDLGQLLFPNFNALAPHLVEALSLLSRTASHKGIMELTWKVLNYAFRECLFPRRAQYWLEHKRPYEAVYDTSSKLQMLYNVEQDAGVCTPLKPDAVYFPFNLDFQPSTRIFKRKVDHKVTQLSRKSKGVFVSPKSALNKTDQLPLYPLFKSPAISRLLTHELRHLTNPQKKQLKTTQQFLVAHLLCVMLSPSLSKIKKSLSSIHSRLEHVDQREELASLLVELEVISLLCACLAYQELKEEAVAILLQLCAEPGLSSQLSISPCFELVSRALQKSLEAKEESILDDLLVIMQRISLKKEVKPSRFSVELIQLLNKALSENEEQFRVKNIGSILHYATL